MQWLAVDGSGVLLGTWSSIGTELDVRTFTLDTRDEARIAAMIADPQLLPSSPVVAVQGEEDLASFAADTDRHLTFCLGAALLGAHDDANKETSTTKLAPPGWVNVIRPTTDANGALKEKTTYAAYGEPTNKVMQTQKGYIGERYDQESGLSYLNARYMNPLFGFTSPDAGSGMRDNGVANSSLSIMSPPIST